MTVLITLILAAMADPSPVELLRQVRDRYQQAASFSMRIEHHDSSGLYPGSYAQALRWKKGGRFELLVTSDGERKVPNFYADGDRVLWIFPDGTSDGLELRPLPGTSPGWEVAGGLILSWLQSNENGRILLDPPKELTIEWSYGAREEWQARKVREIVGTVALAGKRSTASLFVDAAKRSLVGIEGRSGAKIGWALYSDQKLNPDLPATLGSPPR